MVTRWQPRRLSLRLPRRALLEPPRRPLPLLELAQPIMALFLRSNGLARLAPSVATASSSSAPSRVFSSSPASLGTTPGKMVKSRSPSLPLAWDASRSLTERLFMTRPEVKNVANKSKQGERGPRNRRRASYLVSADHLFSPPSEDSEQTAPFVPIVMCSQ